MFNRFSACLAAAFLAIAGVACSPVQAQSFVAADAFSSLKGTTSIDSGGSIHSQARSIYSFGGGMRSFNGKRSTFFAVDPPSFGAGCAGISWHFGGFSFISMDELRQLVEAISQAALGIAVDLAIQTLCPQCYAVMSKLRDMANMMRNAAADACRVAQNMGKLLGHQLGLPTTKQTQCAEGTSEQGKTSGFLDSMAGKACRGMDAVNKFLGDEASGVMSFLNGDWQPGQGNTPTKKQIDMHYNVQYEILGVLGFKDSLVKDMFLNFTGMTIYNSKPDKGTCAKTFAYLSGSSTSGDTNDGQEKTDIDAIDGYGGTSYSRKNPNPKPTKTGVTEGVNVCHLPPRLTGVEDIATKLICGFNPLQDAKTYARRFNRTPETIANSSIGAMCAVMLEKTNKNSFAEQPHTVLAGNPLLYTCRGNRTGKCTEPKEERYSNLLSGGNNFYTGLAWYIADALELGVFRVANNQPLAPDTLAILNGTDYPLYRLINMAAVYPGMAFELINSYAAVIATEYAANMLDKLMRPGAVTHVELRGTNSNISHAEIQNLRQSISNMIDAAAPFMDRTLERLNKKNALVQSILNINRALQAEVITQGLSGNEAFALSLKRQIEGVGQASP